MKKIAILAHPNVALFELACATELFALPRPELTNWYQTKVISLNDGPFECIGGVTISCSRQTTLTNFDTLIIPSWPVDNKLIDKKLATTILEFAASGKQILSFCSGAFLLGYLGLLDHREATTHWQYERHFKAAFPKAHYQPNVLYVLDEKIGCSAGSAAAIDLGLAMIRADYGNDIANTVARRLVLSGHRKGGQAQFVEAPISRRPNRLSDTMDWAIKNLPQNLSIDELAQRANMSRRSFDRTFAAQMGISPQKWLLTQRIMLACRLLETSNTTIEQIAAQSGFSNAGNLRHQFKRQLAMSPRQYRDRFHG